MHSGQGPCEPFQAVVRLVGQCVEREIVAQGDDFSSLLAFKDCVYLKNDDGVLVFSNEAHKRFFSPGVSPIGRTGSRFLHRSIAPASRELDALVRQGCAYVECEHYGRGPDGSAYRLLTHKRNLKPLGVPGLAILGVTRVLEQMHEADAKPLLELSDAFRAYQSLEERDQEICRMTALGATSRELAEQIGMTARGIELRKQKAYAALGVEKGVDLVRLLVRLQDRGYLDLGL